MMMLFQAADIPATTVIVEMMSNETFQTLTAATMVVSIIQWLKKATWIPFVNQHSAGINRTISWGAAIIAGAGIHYNYDAAAGTLIFTGITAASISAAVWNSLQSYFSQLAVYYGLFKARAADVAAAAEALPAKPVVVATPGVAAAAVETVKDGGVKE